MMNLIFLLGCPAPTEPIDPIDPQPVLDTCALPTAIGQCGTPSSRGALISGPMDEGYSTVLEDRVPLVERSTELTRLATGASCEVQVIDPAVALSEIEAGTASADLVQSWRKAAGAYAGVAIAADAFRYGTLRDEGAPCDEVDRARELLLRSLEVLHTAQEVTGTPGVIARGFARKDWPGAGTNETVPLFDAQGEPLPAEKTNGTWREDVSGMHPDLIWEDSVSRDQYIGWIAGMAGAWEVIHADPDIPDGVREQLRSDAGELLTVLMTVQESGFDLELQDADGRATFHAILHHESIDRVYTPGLDNSLNAMMALGIVAALVAVTDDPEGRTWLDEELIGVRQLPTVSAAMPVQLAIGTQTNFSAINMAYLGGWLAQRHLCDGEARADVQAAMDLLHTEGTGSLTAPEAQHQALYDLVLALGDRNAMTPGGEADRAAMERTVAGLKGFRSIPMLDEELVNCDALEIEAAVCELVDGTVVDLLGEVGRNGALIADVALPIAARPPSNYHWRSNPYEVNGGGTGTLLYPLTDWRFVYWAGRWSR